MAYDSGALLQNIALNEFARQFDALWSDDPSGDLVPSKYRDYHGGKEAFSGHSSAKFLRRIMGIVNVWDITCIHDLHRRHWLRKPQYGSANAGYWNARVLTTT